MIVRPLRFVINYHFSVSQRKTLRSRARGYLIELRRATCPEESHSSFCFSYLPMNFLRLPATSPRPLSLAYTKLCLSHAEVFFRSDISLLLHIFNLSWSLHSTSFVTLIHKMRKPLDSPASFRPIFLTFCVSKVFGRIILSLSFSVPARTVSALNGLL